MVDFMADQELLVRVEAIEMYVEHMQHITKIELEKDFIPSFI